MFVLYRSARSRERDAIFSKFGHPSFESEMQPRATGDQEMRYQHQ